MKPLDLKEFAESMLLGQHGDFAREILELITISDCYDEQNEWIEDMVQHVPADVTEKGDQKSLEWIADRLAILEKVEERLDKAGFTGFDGSITENIDDLCNDYEAAEELLLKADFVSGDLAEKVALALERLPVIEPLEYDL